MIEKYVLWILKNKTTVLVSTLLVCILSAIGLVNLKISTDFRVYLDSESQDVVNLELIEDKFTKNETLYIAILPEKQSVFDKNVLHSIVRLTDELWLTPFSVRVDSISNFQNTKVFGDDINVENLVPDYISTDDLSYIEDVANKEPLLKNLISSESGKATAIQVTLHLSDDLNERMKQTPQSVKFVRELLEKYKADYPDVNYHLAGSVMMNHVMGEAAFQDILTLVPFCYIAVALLLFILLRNIWGVIVTLTIVSLANMLVLGISGWLEHILAPIIGFVPSAILVIAVADCVHILTSYYKNIQAGENKNISIINSVSSNIMPVTVTSLTTIVGFLCLNFNESPPYRDLGNMIAAGTFVAFILSVFFLPAVLALLPLPKVNKKNFLVNTMEKLGRHITIFYKFYLFVCTAVTLSLGYLMFDNKLNDNWNNYFDMSFDFRVASEQINTDITGLHRIDYMISTEQDGGISNPKLLIFVDKFKSWYEQQPQIANITALSDTFKRLNKSMNGDVEDEYKLPTNVNLASQYLLFYEMSLPYGLGLNNIVSFDKKSSRVSVIIYKTSSEDVLEIADNAQLWLEKNTPEFIQVSNGVGLDIAFANIARSNTKSMLWGTLVAFLIISIMLGLITQSFKYGVISLVPNILPAICAFGVWGITVGEIGLATSAVVSMAIGVIVDDTVHFLTKYKFARIKLNLSPEKSIEYAFGTVGTAMVITTIVLVVGFVIMGLSPFQPTSHMGNLLALTIFTALVVDLLFLPSILLFFDKQKIISRISQSTIGDEYG